jgi:ubiquinone/menaquinone biosynthesis C-methylase UbiE
MSNITKKKHNQQKQKNNKNIKNNYKPKKIPYTKKQKPRIKYNFNEILKQKQIEKDERINTAFNKYPELKLNAEQINKLINCKIESFLHIKNEMDIYNKFYCDANQNKQLVNIIKYGSKYDNVYVNRLISLLMKFTNSEDYTKLYNLVIDCSTDDEVYNKLRALYKEFNFGKYPKHLCSKNQIIAELFTKQIKLYKHDFKFERILDVGCGSCKFPRVFGRNLGLRANQIFGVDVESFSEQGDWGRSKSGMVFKGIEPNKRYPFPDNYFSVISANMVLHHIEDIDFTLSEINRVLKPGGVFCVLEHDNFTPLDNMIADIEHLMYTEVYNYNQDDKQSKNDKLGYIKYYNWIELDYLMIKHNFKHITGKLLSLGVKYDINASRTQYNLYVKF